MPSTTITSLLASNADTVAADYAAPPTMTQFRAALQANPANGRMCIITCADPRCNPAKAFALDSHPNLTTVTLTNAGGSPRNALPALLVMDTLVNLTDVLILRHTDCGTTFFRDGDLKETVLARVQNGGSGSDSDSNDAQQQQQQQQKDAVETLYFGACETGPRDMCAEDVRWLRENTMLREELRGHIWGGVLDLESGRVEGVE